MKTIVLEAVRHLKWSELRHRKAASFRRLNQPVLSQAFADVVSQGKVVPNQRKREWSKSCSHCHWCKSSLTPASELLLIYTVAWRAETSQIYSSACNVWPFNATLMWLLTVHSINLVLFPLLLIETLLSTSAEAGSDSAGLINTVRRKSYDSFWPLRVHLDECTHVFPEG